MTTYIHECAFEFNGRELPVRIEFDWRADEPATGYYGGPEIVGIARGDGKPLAARTQKLLDTDFGREWEQRELDRISDAGDPGLGLWDDEPDDDR